MTFPLGARPPDILSRGTGFTAQFCRRRAPLRSQVAPIKAGIRGNRPFIYRRPVRNTPSLPVYRLDHRFRLYTGWNLSDIWGGEAGIFMGDSGQDR
jgi:hypothetical protein